MPGTLLSPAKLGIAVGLAGAAFLGYCVYFDNKRRSHPEFRKQLIERRRRRNNKSAESPDDVPILSDQKSIAQYFMQEIKKGELLLSQGDLEGSAEHFMNAITVCNAPGKLLSMLQTSLPVQAFDLLLNKLNKLNSYHMQTQRMPNALDGMVVDDGSVE
ncbi:maker200 [Drosophila busckii]|uniref:Maker200 n=1 Tax=Drosophila busckii TaxID=30019 RepID=A0A0M4F4Z0_DROBS|nr:mitochondrial import receptor subunit TOM20 homolog [Drosophila busckii]ALC46520.1 maker200 [Drosophila busckii]